VDSVPESPDQHSLFADFSSTLRYKNRQKCIEINTEKQSLFKETVTECIKLLKDLSQDIILMKEQKLLRLVSEMLKNSKKSDRELAGILGVSQPTVSRTRARIEKEYIKTYTIIPDFKKLGYQIMAFTFAKTKGYPGNEAATEMTQKSKEWIAKRPNVIFSADGEGLGKDLVLVSFHKNYSAYAEFMRSFAMDWGTYIDTFESFLVSIGSGYTLRDFDLKYLADDI